MSTDPKGQRRTASKRLKPAELCHCCKEELDEPAAFGHRLREGVVTVDVKLTARRGVPPGDAFTMTTSRRRYCRRCAVMVMDVLEGINP